MPQPKVIIAVCTVLLLLLISISSYGNDKLRNSNTPEVPDVTLGMTVKQVISTFKERGANAIERKLQSNDELTLFYDYIPRNDITPIHPSWVGSRYELIFVREHLTRINWYKKDGRLLKADIQSLFFGPKSTMDAIKSILSQPER